MTYGERVGASAAFFDLDKTILARSSSFAFARPFYASGLIGRRHVARSAYAQFMYLLSGANHDEMERMRAYLADLITGWDVQQVRDIVEETLDDVIEPMIHAEAVELIAEHRAAGRDIVIISTSGSEIVAPIGARLGADVTIGTQVAIEDGRYTGEVTFYAYGPNKAAAMRELAEERGYDLAASFAYSDSHTDLPMLEAVGFPTAVNPDAALRRTALDRGWPISDFRRPVALRRSLEPRHALAGMLAGTALATAAGLVWYSRRRR